MSIILDGVSGYPLLRSACLGVPSAWDERSEAGHQNVVHHGLEDLGHSCLDHGKAPHQNVPSCFQAPVPSFDAPGRIPAPANHASATGNTFVELAVLQLLIT